MTTTDLLEAIRPEIRGLGKVRVNKENLLEILQQNRDEHRTIFEEAIDNWHQQVQEQLQKMVEQAKQGPEAVVLQVGLPRPEDHTTDYERAIKMLELSLDTEFELTATEFSQYVMDDWGWQHDFLTTASNYSETAQRKFNRASLGQ